MSNKTSYLLLALLDLLQALLNELLLKDQQCIRTSALILTCYSPCPGYSQDYSPRHAVIWKAFTPSDQSDSSIHPSCGIILNIK